MSVEPTQAGAAELDLPDVDAQVGKPVGGGQLLNAARSKKVLFFSAEEITLTGTAKIRAGELREVAAKRLRTASAGVPSPKL